VPRRVFLNVCHPGLDDRVVFKRVGGVKHHDQESLVSVVLSELLLNSINDHCGKMQVTVGVRAIGPVMESSEGLHSWGVSNWPQYPYFAYGDGLARKCSSSGST
jgi:hypothetical protein